MHSVPHVMCRLYISVSHASTSFASVMTRFILCVPCKESLNVLPLKDDQHSEQGMDLLKRLSATLSELPLENYMTLAYIIYHLRR